MTYRAPPELKKILANHFLVFAFVFGQTNIFYPDWVYFCEPFLGGWASKASKRPLCLTLQHVSRTKLLTNYDSYHLQHPDLSHFLILQVVPYWGLQIKSASYASLCIFNFFQGSKKCGKAQLQVTWCHSQYGLIGCARNSAQLQVRGVPFKVEGGRVHMSKNSSL